MQDIIGWLVGLFVIDPLQAELARRLTAARAPQAVIGEVRACLEAATPVVSDRLTSDPVWFLDIAFRAWTGLERPDILVVRAVPACRPALEAARPFLQDAGA